MQGFALSRLVDALALGEPGAHGYGYADTQHPWRYDPAIDLPRPVLLDFLGSLHGRPTERGALVLGDDRHGGLSRLLSALYGHVEAGGQSMPRGDRSFDLGVVFAEDYAAAWRDWSSVAHRVRPGGVVAIIESTAVLGPDRPWCGPLELIAELEQRLLRPNGSSWQRWGAAHAIHGYVQTAATAAPDLVSARVPDPRDQVATLGRAGDMAIFRWRDLHYAVPAAGPAFSPRTLHENRHELVLAAPDPEAVLRVIAAVRDVEPHVECALHALRDGRLAVARTEARACAERLTDTELATSLNVAPDCTRLLRIEGTRRLFGVAPGQGAALLRRVLDQAPLDRNLLLAVGTAYEHVCRDPQASRSLLECTRRELRRRNLTDICYRELRGHVLWRYPQALLDVRSVVVAGFDIAHHARNFTKLPIERQTYIEGNPQALTGLRHELRATPSNVIAATLWSTPAEGELLGHADGSHGVLPPHTLASTAPSRRLGRVAMTTLDALLAAQPTAVDLLVVDAAGAELAVLQGAGEVLRNVDLVAVAIYVAPVYADCPAPQQLQTFLRNLADEGFALRAFETTDDPRRGHALFRRCRRRGAR